MKEHDNNGVQTVEYSYDDWLNGSDWRMRSRHFPGHFEGIYYKFKDDDLDRIKNKQKEIYFERVDLALEIEKYYYRSSINEDESIDPDAYRKKKIIELKHVLGIEKAEHGKQFHFQIDIKKIQDAYNKYLLTGKRPFDLIIPVATDSNMNLMFRPENIDEAGICIRADAAFKFMTYLSNNNSPKERTFASYINHSKADQLIDFITPHYKSAKPKSLAGLVVALEEKGVYYKEDNVSQLHNSLNKVFGDIGSLRGFTEQLKKQRESIDSYNQDRSAIDVAHQYIDDALKNIQHNHLLF